MQLEIDLASTALFIEGLSRHITFWYHEPPQYGDSPQDVIESCMWYHVSPRRNLIVAWEYKG